MAGSKANIFGSHTVYRAVENRVPAILFLWAEAGSIIVDPYGQIVEDIAPEKEIVMEIYLVGLLCYFL